MADDEIRPKAVPQRFQPLVHSRRVADILLDDSGQKVPVLASIAAEPILDLLDPGSFARLGLGHEGAPPSVSACELAGQIPELSREVPVDKEHVHVRDGRQAAAARQAFRRGADRGEGRQDSLSFGRPPPSDRFPPKMAPALGVSPSRPRTS